MEDKQLNTEEEVMKRYLEIMNTSEVGSEEHTKALNGYKELKDRCIQLTRISNEEYYRIQELQLKEAQLSKDEYYKNREMALKEAQIELDKKAKRKNFVIETLKVAVPIGLAVGNYVFQSIWIKRINEFETTGTYTNTSSKRLVDAIFNFKK